MEQQQAPAGVLGRRALLGLGSGLVALGACRSAAPRASGPSGGTVEVGRRRFLEPHDRELLGALGELAGTRVLDAGCGRGDHALLFARLGCREVVALDLAPDRVALVEERAREQGLAVAARRGDVNALPYPDGHFDLVWSSHVLHFMPEPVGVARELARVVRPGGTVVLREDRALARLLPQDVGLGAPGLESRMVASFEAWLARDRAERGRLEKGWLGVLAEAGLADTRARSVLHERYGLFDDDERAYLRDWLARSVELELEPEDRKTLMALTTEGGPHDALARSDLHFVSVSSLYLGRVAG